MQAQDRLVNRSTRPIVFGIVVALVIAAALVAIALLAGGQHAARPATNGATVVIAHQQAPDAKDRNDAYSQALASQFNNMSPDAQDRNVQLSRR